MSNRNISFRDADKAATFRTMFHQDITNQWYHLNKELERRFRHYRWDDTKYHLYHIYKASDVRHLPLMYRIYINEILSSESFRGVYEGGAKRE